MAAIKNKDILNVLVDLFDTLDKKIKLTNESMEQLEKTIKRTNSGTSGENAKKLVENTETLNKEIKKLTELEKAQLSVKQQIEKTNAKIIVAQSDEAKQLAKINEELKKQNTINRLNSQNRSNEIGAYKKLSQELTIARNRYKDLAAEQKHNTKEGKELLVQVTKLDAKLKQIDANVGQHTRNVGNYGSAFEKLGGSIKGFIAGLEIQQLFSFGKEIINTRAEFEKLEVVLGNTLGSNEKAAQSFQMIQEFASKTPFSVLELTESFVKLTNQGFKPSLQEMENLGDLASSTGKSFQQLAEAILDAQTGEFERLKEFGIKTKVEGDKVSFTFKEQTTTVENNSAAIRDYIIALGDMEGVSGANAKIAGTLTGQLSNLGDSWDGLKNSLGKVIDVPVSSFLSEVSKEINDFSGDVNNAGDSSLTFFERINGWIDVIARVSPALYALNERMKEFFGINEKLAKLQFDRDLKSAKERGKQAALDQIEREKKLKESKETSEKISDSEISANKKKNEELEKQALEKANYEFELERRLNIIMNNEDLEASKKHNESKVITDKEYELSKLDENERFKLANKELFDYNNSLRSDDLILSAEYSAKTKEIQKDATEFALQQMAFMAASGKASAKDFAKFTLTLLLDSVEKTLLLNIATIWSKQLAEKGFLGIPLAVALTAIVKGVFAGAKSRISNFATGTEYVNGPGSETSDSIPANLSKGERIVPAKINKLLMGIPNNRLPELVNSGINTQRMESILDEMRYYNKMSSLYLSNGSNTYVNDGFLVINDWKTGKTIKMPIKN